MAVLDHKIKTSLYTSDSGSFKPLDHFADEIFEFSLFLMAGIIVLSVRKSNQEAIAIGGCAIGEHLDLEVIDSHGVSGEILEELVDVLG